MFCLDVHSRATSLMSTEHGGGCVPAAILCRTITPYRERDGQNWNCCMLQQAALLLVFLSFHTQPPCFCCQETQSEQVCVCADQLWIFNSEWVKASKPTLVVINKKFVSYEFSSYIYFFNIKKASSMSLVTKFYIVQFSLVCFVFWKWLIIILLSWKNNLCYLKVIDVQPVITRK